VEHAPLLAEGIATVGLLDDPGLAQLAQALVEDA
jgi:hypothetical protein